MANCDNKGNRLALVEFLTGSDAERTVWELKSNNSTWLIEYCAPGETLSEILRWMRIPVSVSNTEL